MQEIMRMTSSAASMTSREIADLVGSRHDSVKRTIETFVAKGIITQPHAVDESYKDSTCRNVVTKVYVFSGEHGKRDSIIVVAQLSPEFTAKLVDRWQELESRVQIMDTTTQLAHAVLLAQKVLAEKQEVIQRLETKVEVDAPKVEFFDHVTTSDVWLDMKAAAKQLDFVEVGRNKLFEILRRAKVLDAKNEPYQTYVDRGYFKSVPVPYGVNKVQAKTVVSYKGVDWIRKNLTRHRFTTHSDLFKEAA